MPRYLPRREYLLLLRRERQFPVATEGIASCTFSGFWLLNQIFAVVSPVPSLSLPMPSRIFRFLRGGSRTPVGVRSILVETRVLQKLNVFGGYRRSAELPKNDNFTILECLKEARFIQCIATPAHRRVIKLREELAEHSLTLIAFSDCLQKDNDRLESSAFILKTFWVDWPESSRMLPRQRPENLEYSLFVTPTFPRLMFSGAVFRRLTNRNQKARRVGPLGTTCPAAECCAPVSLKLPDTRFEPLSA